MAAVAAVKAAHGPTLDLWTLGCELRARHRYLVTLRRSLGPKQPKAYLRSLRHAFLLVRGVVYPKWLKRKNEVPASVRESLGELELLENRWQVSHYAYSFSKHIRSPTSSRLVASALYNQHVQICPYKRVRVIADKFKIY